MEVPFKMAALNNTYQNERVLKYLLQSQRRDYRKQAE